MRLKSAKKGLQGKISWEIVEAGGDKIIAEGTTKIAFNTPDKNTISVGKTAFGYSTILNLKHDGRTMSIYFIGKMDDCYSFYSGGKGYVGMFAAAWLPVGEKKKFFRSGRKWNNRYARRVSHKRIQVTKEFRHAWHSYIAGIKFQDDWGTRVRSFYPKVDNVPPVIIRIKKGSWFELGNPE